MKNVVAVLLSIIVLVSADAPTEEDGVLVLTTKNFDETVKNADVMLVEFYAPWCGHCKKLAPEYAAAAKQLKDNDPPIPLAKVDATVESDLGNKFGVKGYPTMKVFRKGNPSDYSGPRDTKGIVSYMQKQVGPSAKPISTSDAFKKFLEHKDVSIVGFFSAASGKLHEAFTKTADTLRDEFRFAIVTDSKLADEQGYKNQDKVVMFTSFDDKKYEYSGTSDSSTLQNWLYATCLPRVGELTKENEARYKKRNLPILKAYFDVDWASNVKHTNYYVNRMKKVLDNDKSLKDKLSFAVVSRKQFSDEMNKFGLEGKDFGVAIDDFANSQKYKMVGEFSVANLEQFVKDFFDHKLESYIKSEPIPEPNDGGVKVVVGKNFKDIVLDPTKDVLLEMYAPWCGHCKKLEPIYNELGNKLKDVPGLTIAKMDATANDSPHSKYQARGYPTILFAPANNKDNPISYSGEREVKAFESWLKDKATTAWKKKDEL